MTDKAQELLVELADVLTNQNPARIITLNPYIKADLQQRIIAEAKS
jgi:hypothetical protein